MYLRQTIVLATNMFGNLSQLWKNGEKSYDMVDNVEMNLQASDLEPSANNPAVPLHRERTTAPPESGGLVQIAQPPSLKCSSPDEVRPRHRPSNVIKEHPGVKTRLVAQVDLQQKAIYREITSTNKTQHAVLKKAQEEASARERQLAKKDELLAERDRLIQERDRRLQELETALMTMGIELESKKVELAEVNEQLAKTNKELEDLKQTMAKRDEKFNALKTQVRPHCASRVNS